MAKKVTIYTTTTCAYCVMVKRYLASKGLSYDEINLDLTPERRQEAIDLSGQMNVPVTVVSDEASGQREIAIGWNPGKLASALAA